MFTKFSQHTLSILLFTASVTSPLFSTEATSLLYHAYSNKASTRITTALGPRKADISRMGITVIDYAPPSGHIRNLRYGLTFQSTDEHSGGRFQSKTQELHLGVRSFDDAWRADFDRSNISMSKLSSSASSLSFKLDRAYFYRNLEIGQHSLQLGAVAYNINSSRLDDNIQGYLPYFSYAYQIDPSWSFSIMRSELITLEYNAVSSPWRAKLLHGSFAPSLYYNPDIDQILFLYNDFALTVEYAFNQHVCATFEVGGYATSDYAHVSSLNRESINSGNLAYKAPWETFHDLRFSEKLSPYMGVCIAGSWK